MTQTGHPRTELAHIDADDVAQIARLLREHTGIKVLPAQASMLQSRLGRRLRGLGMKQFHDYVAYVTSRQGEGELREMISALTTNVTNFFREKHHFDQLSAEVLPPLIERARQGARIRLWSAACSSGQEPYSMAMCLLDLLPDAKSLDIRVLGTDIDVQMLQIAREGIYSAEHIENMSPEMRNRYFQRRPDGFHISTALRDIVTFRELNLHQEWPMRGRFDAIMCRNVAIYFDLEAQGRLWRRLERALAPEGWLFLGHSERIPSEIPTALRSAGVTAYHLPGASQTRSL
ncbi:CheR family methyltransferase [Paenirhodobacter enshiensis]|uniref:CheR family methyltransferase n=1 Tax=Paenirhodobacter enshiensis TaxID=1105367 RepID=UPI000691408E|nr:protein-glutamate O-methyltransferase [Paenirhodobacter enshiensis]